MRSTTSAALAVLRRPTTRERMPGTNKDLRWRESSDDELGIALTASGKHGHRGDQQRRSDPCGESARGEHRRPRSTRASICTGRLPTGARIGASRPRQFGSLAAEPVVRGSGSCIGNWTSLLGLRRPLRSWRRLLPFLGTWQACREAARCGERDSDRNWCGDSRCGRAPADAGRFLRGSLDRQAQVRRGVQRGSGDQPRRCGRVRVAAAD